VLGLKGLHSSTFKYIGIRRVIWAPSFWVANIVTFIGLALKNHARIARFVLLQLGNMLLAHPGWRLAEVERAAALLRSIGLGKQIKRVETLQDDLVYANTTHDAFVRILWCNLPVISILTAWGKG
jgi:hypothetical protein